MRASLVLFFGLALTVVPAFANLQFTLAATVVAGTTSGCINFSGGCVVFSGTLQNDGADDLFLNDTSVVITQNGGTDLSSNPNFFFANVPGLLCSATDAACPFPSTYTGPVFQIEIAPGASAAVYSGTITILGGSQGASNALANQDFQINLAISSPLQISTAPALPTGTAGQIYPREQFAASGGTPPYTWSVAPVPTGIAIDNTGLLTGTPVVGSQGSYPAVIKVTDSLNATASVPRTLNINPQLLITSPSALSAGMVGNLYSPVQFTASGGSGVYTWTAMGLPSGMTFSSSGVLGGTPMLGDQNSYNPQFTVTDSNGAAASVSFSLTINSAPPPSITSISPNPIIAAIGAQTIFINGSGFQNGSLTVHLTNGAFQTDLTGSPVTFFSATQLSIRADVGSTAASWTATVINPDGQSSNTFTFSVQVSQTTTFALPQYTFGGAWYTALYFANTSNLVAHIQVNFYDDNAVPLSVPLLGIGFVTSQSIDVNPQSTVILEAPNSSNPQQEGWAEVALPTGVTGYAVFRQTVAGRADQEAAVPLTPESSLTADLTYDDILFTTAVAFLNPTAQPVTVTISTFDVNGVPNGTAQQVLGPRAKTATVLKTIPGLSGISGNRGRAVFSVASGAVSVLGLRFGGSAFTTIPVVERPATPGTNTITFAVPQFVFGGAWYTALYFSNTTDAPVNVPVTFSADNSGPLTVPLLGIGSVTAQTVMLNPGATEVLEAPDSGPAGQGWVQASVPPGVTGYAVFRQTVAGRPDQEAAVPLTLESSQATDLVYDDIAFTTSVAFLNPSDQQVTVTILVFSANGAQIGSAQVVLAPQSKVATILRDLPGLSAMSGNRGWASFSVPNGDVSVIGLRFGGAAFTAIPVTQR